MTTAPETYLRLASEWDMLSTEPRRAIHDGFEGVIIGRALVAAGGLTKEAARGVLDEYTLAIALRDPQRGHMVMRAMVQPPMPKQPLSAQRVVVGSCDFQHAGEPWRLERALFVDDAIDVRLAGAVPPNWMRNIGFPGRSGSGPPTQPFPRTLALRDDRGASVTGHVGESTWGGGGWQARYRSDRPLSPDTRWIEIDGVRIELPERRPLPPSRVEEIDPLPPLRAMLVGEILSTDRVHGDRDSYEIAARALVATGLLDEEDTLLEETRRIWRALATATPEPGLPAPWDSLLSRFGKSDGITGSLAIGTTIEDLEGYAIRFDSLTSDEGSFSVALAVSPGNPLLRHFPGMGIDVSPVTWWAKDDRGNTYVAFFSRGGGGPTAEGEVRSLAPLDPRATELTLLPTTTHARGVVRLSLADLGGRG